jgi:NADPH:quinone reductase-like Zn-dependent oxidoreductase
MPLAFRFDRCGGTDVLHVEEAELAGLIDNGQLEIPIAAVYPLARVQDAYRELEQGHTLGKIVLKP